MPAPEVASVALEGCPSTLCDSIGIWQLWFCTGDIAGNASEPLSWCRQVGAGMRDALRSRLAWQCQWKGTLDHHGAPRYCGKVMWGWFSLCWLRICINHPRPHGALGSGGYSSVVVDHPQAFVLDASRAVGLSNMAAPAALPADMMLLSRTLCSFWKGRIWQDREEEMQVFPCIFIFLLVQAQPHEVSIHFSSPGSCTQQIQ